MLQKKYILIIVLVVITAIAWVKFGEKAMATVSYQTYETQTYSYDVEIDQFYDESERINSQGILVHLHPEKDTQNPSQFSSVYWQANQGNLQTFLTDTKENTQVDVMLIFKQPLALIEANQLLDKVGANVFESGLVGYMNGIPFAHYTVETGTLNPTVWAELETTMSQESKGQNQILGYMAVRAWVKVEKLPVLSTLAQVEAIDITPQMVRNTLAHNDNWANTPILSLSLEMPVWGYKWE